MFVKPKDGLKIRDPFRKDFLPPEGRDVPETDMYWQRLLRDKDVTLAEAPEPPASATTETKAEA